MMDVYSDGTLHASVEQSDKNLVDMLMGAYKMRFLKEAKERQVDLENQIRLQDVLNVSQSVNQDAMDEDDMDCTRDFTPHEQQWYVSSGYTPGKERLQPEFSLAVQEGL